MVRSALSQSKHEISEHSTDSSDNLTDSSQLPSNAVIGNVTRSLN